MIKNKGILKLIKEKKQEKTCDQCKHCDLNAYHRGQWYCSKRSVFDCLEDINECFETEI